MNTSWLLVLLIVGCAMGHYGDPYKLQCESDEVSVAVTGVEGKFCSPPCTGANDTCPTDVPSGVTATPQCTLHSSEGDKYCALVCTPGAGKAVLDAQCGLHASCKPISGTGICTYDDGPPPPESKHWKAFHSPSFEEMSEAIDIEFINPMVGWVGGGDNEVGAEIKKSVDGGLTWTRVFPANSSQPKFDIFLSAKAKSEKNVIVGGALFQVYSVDGSTFNHSLNDYLSPSQDAELIPGSNLFALIGQGNKCNGVSTSKIGFSWKCAGDIGVNASQFPVRYGSFPSEKVWYVTAGTWPDQAAAAATKGSHSLSQNVLIHHDKNPRGYEIVVDSPRARGANGNYTALISKTTDGGKTWQTVHKNNTDYYFNDIDCISETHCVAVAEGEGGHIFVTKDGGTTWDQVYNDGDPQTSLMRVRMLSEKEVWATGGHLANLGFHGIFFHSMDGGATFEEETIKGLYIIDIDMIDQTHGFAIGLTLQTGLTLVKYKTPNATTTTTAALELTM